VFNESHKALLIFGHSIQSQLHSGRIFSAAQAEPPSAAERGQIKPLAIIA
jgi:hypothetical protein